MRNVLTKSIWKLIRKSMLIGDTLVENCNIHRSSNLNSPEKTAQKVKQNPVEFKSLTIICVFGLFYSNVFGVFKHWIYSTQQYKIVNLTEREQLNRLSSFNMNRTCGLKKTICSLFISCHKSIELNNLVWYFFSVIEHEAQNPMPQPVLNW